MNCESEDKYTREKILDIRAWTPSLFSFKTTRYRGYRFVPGQFARLGVKKNERVVWRAYSIVSADYDEHLEFYSIVVPDGEFTTELTSLQIGDELLVEKKNYGFLTRDRFEAGRDLWMLSTGTGLAPFISILYDFKTWEDYENLVLVHSARNRRELAYQDVIRGFASSELFSQFAHKLKYIPVVTREKIAGVLDKRIPALLASGELEGAAGIALDHERSRIMVCGNPEMVDETRAWLTSNGYQISRRGQPGHLAVENLW